MDGPDRRHLWAHVDDAGTLHIEGQDLGPSTAIVSTDGECEWHETINARDLPLLLTLLGAPSDANILDVLERHWAGDKAGNLEALIRNSDIQVKRSVWAG